jgi:hypothetical protein
MLHSSLDGCMGRQHRHHHHHHHHKRFDIRHQTSMFPPAPRVLTNQHPTPNTNPAKQPKQPSSQPASQPVKVGMCVLRCGLRERERRGKKKKDSPSTPSPRSSRMNSVRETQKREKEKGEGEGKFPGTTKPPTQPPIHPSSQPTLCVPSPTHNLGKPHTTPHPIPSHHTLLTNFQLLTPALTSPHLTSSNTSDDDACVSAL